MPFRCSEEDGIFVVAAIGVIRAVDVPDLQKEEDKFFKAHPTDRALFLCDCTEMKVISPEAGEVLLNLMKKDTPRLARAAFVLGEGINALQLRRMIREVGSAKRQTFNTREEAMAWLKSPLV